MIAKTKLWDTCTMQLQIYIIFDKLWQKMSFKQRLKSSCVAFFFLRCVKNQGIQHGVIHRFGRSNAIRTSWNWQHSWRAPPIVCLFVCFSQNSWVTYEQTRRKSNATQIKRDGGKTNATEIKHDANQTRRRKKTNATAQLKITTHMCPLWNTIQFAYLTQSKL